jgi:hypothetical protein
MPMATFREEYEDPENAAPPGPPGVEPPPLAPEPEPVPPGTVPPMLAAPPPPPPPEMLARPDEEPLPPAAPPPSPATGGAPIPAAPPPATLSPEEKAANAARIAAGQQQVSALQAEKTAVTDRAKAVSVVDSEESKLMQEASSNAKKIRDAEQAKLDQAREDIKNFKETDLFQGNDAARVGAWILAGIGEFAAKRSGTTNTPCRC